MHASLIHKRITQINEAIAQLQAEKQQLESQLLAENLAQADSPVSSQPATFNFTHIPVQPMLTTEQKLQLFSERFYGRQDVYAYRWQNKQGKSGYSVACQHEWQAGICHKPKIKCADCQYRQFKPLDFSVLYEHLSGKITVGIYPLLTNNTCRLLAIDLDKADWQQAVSAITVVCDSLQIDYLVERSRSGNGAHIWFFFAEPILASKARQLGILILDGAMEQYPALSFESYDRMFPNQDSMPIGGFGNLIALPLQKQARLQGNSTFIDSNFNVIADPWHTLQTVELLTQEFIDELIVIQADRLSENNGFLADSYEPVWQSFQPVIATIAKDNEADNYPKQLPLILANRLFIDTKILPNRLQAQLIRLASYNNPNFYKAQAMRFSTFGIPRRVCLAHLEQETLSLPRGCFTACLALLQQYQVKVVIDDKRQTGVKLLPKIPKILTNQITLTPEQQQAVQAILQSDIGVLQAPTGFGKTLVAMNVMVTRNTNTLILVHNKALLKQWQQRLISYLAPPNDNQIQRFLANVEIATYQGLVDKATHNVKPLAFNYGQVIIDECHHVSAPNYMQILNEIAPKYVLGLTATPERQDGHHPIVFMQAGQVVFHAKTTLATDTFNEKQAICQILDTQFPEDLLQSEQRVQVSQLLTYLADCEVRNQTIVKDVVTSIQQQRKPLVLTERKNHAQYFLQALRQFGYHCVLLTGGMNTKDLQQQTQNLETADVVIATGKYIGEGFDMPRLDTLFLALPISWRGIATQYIGRIERAYPDKNKVQVFDYIDENHPVFQKMFQRRSKAYRSLGYQIEMND